MLVVLVVVVFAGCGGDGDEGSVATTTTATTLPTGAATITLTSSAFRDGDPIPREYSCEGANTPPPLTWTGVPAGTVALVLTVTDPDAPRGTFVHWVVGLPADATALPAATAGLRNDAGSNGYIGPCPPPADGPHRYVFTLVALDAPFDATDVDTAERLMAEHGTARGTLTGTYDR